MSDGDKMLNDLRKYSSDDPLYHDPRFQRRVVAVHRPIPIIENMFDVTLECGHAPLLFSNSGLEVGAQCFCPTCYEDRDQ